MQKVILPATLLAATLLVALAAPTFAAGYPVSGKWGQSASSDKGPIDCGKLRVIEFKGGQRTDSNGGVPAYRLKTISAEGPKKYRVTDVFTSGQINNAQVSYTLTLLDDDHIALNMQPGGLLKFQRCK